MQINKNMVKQFAVYTECVCKEYGIPQATKPLIEGLISMLEANFAMDKVGSYDVDDALLGNSLSTDAYETNYDMNDVQQLWNMYDEDFAATNGVDAAYQKAVDDLAAQGVDTSKVPADNSAYISAFGTSIEADEAEQPWVGTSGALTESNSFRDQAKYDLNAYYSDADNVGDIKSMGRSLDRYGYRENGVKGMGLSGKFGNAYDLKDDGFGALNSRNSGLAPVGRRIMKRGENEFYNKDIQSQLDDMMTDDSAGVGTVEDIKQRISELYNNWNADNDANGVSGSDADFRQYVEDALNELGIGG